MDDFLLQAELDEYTTLTVSPLDPETYRDYVGDEPLGGFDGYFITRTSKHPSSTRFEVLAKATTFDAADQIFRMILSASRVRPAA